jgi:hypothetical protein
MSRWLRNVLANWSEDDQSALRQMTTGKTVSERIGAFNRTTINQSKFLLAAGAPFFVLLIARELLGLSGWLLWTLVTVAAIWFVLVGGMMLVGMFRVAARASDRRE